MNNSFEEAYKQLNKAQREAVDLIDGPVMVVAGPGTGKTQILALRIGNILKKTDTDPNSILCLTFTNSGVKAMEERLSNYIGTDSRNVVVSTFHSFAIDLIEKNYELLDFSQRPVLLGDDEIVFLIDEILEENDWQYLKPRSNPVMYFNDLQHLVSILKRERITVEQFRESINNEIANLKEDPQNISSRGESKGQLKKETIKKIESLERTKEVVTFYEIYEEKKKEKSLMDYDDALEYAVKLVEEYDDVRDDLRENFLYVLVDEHQDSSGVQNSFLKGVWKGVENPNIFVVGDDRQLIYAFSGASLSYFEEFSHIFGKAKLVVLTENYRSNMPILEIADDLLKSSITNEKLISQKKGKHKIILNEYAYPRDEIIGAGLFFKEKIKEGINPNECAILVPRNYLVRQAISILSDMGLPVSSGKSLSLFEAKETEIFIRILGILTNPFDSKLLAESLLDVTNGIKPIEAHTFLKNIKVDNLTIKEIIDYAKKEGLFVDGNTIYQWGIRLETWVNDLSKERLETSISRLGNELLIDTSCGSEEMLRRIEIVRSFIHLASLFSQRKKNPTIKDFIEYLKRLESYNSQVELAKFGENDGIKVMTLHKSKGLEYDLVWVAHLNEERLMSEKKNPFALPDEIKEHLSKRDVEMAKRELYVAITRAKEICALSYSRSDYNGREMELAKIIVDLKENHFIRKNSSDNEKEILEIDPRIYTSSIINKEDKGEIKEIKDFVSKNYSDLRVSVTMLNNFFECPWKWYFRNFLRLPEEKGLSLILGTVVHETIEYILKSKDKPNEKMVDNQIEYEFKKEGLFDKKLKDDAKIAVMNWVNNFYPNLAKVFESERSLSLKDKDFPNLTMYGKIDLTERKENGEILVTDFKTGQVKTKGVIEKIDEENRMSNLMRQLAMYSYLIDEASFSRLIFLEAKEGDKNASYEVKIDEEKLDLLKRDIKDYDQALSSGDWINRECHNESYGGNQGECEYCKKAQTIFKKALEKDA
ncbi:MAG: ATP-dependent DNA helicase [Candidatus Pacebacteria bacterium]|nr:ATP-dependent DNA helicase [Candidatus Paceibacterota bacterium]